jgi:hypothetical protein
LNAEFLNGPDERRSSMLATRQAAPPHGVSEAQSGDVARVMLLIENLSSGRNSGDPEVDRFAEEFRERHPEETTHLL